MRCDTVRLLAAACLLVGCASNPDVPRESPAEIAGHPPLTDELLDRLVGTWHIDRAIRGTHVENRMTAAWRLGHQFIEMHMIDTASPPAYEAIVLIGRDDEKRRYVAHWCDAFGAEYSAVGHGTRAGDRIEFRFDYESGPFFNTFSYDRAGDTWQFRGEAGGQNGKRTPFALDHATRRGP